MNPDFHQETEQLRQLLNRYAGGWAWIEELLSSHSRLTIAMTKKGLSDTISLFLPFCSDIRSPVNWSDSRLAVECLDLDASPPKMALVDRHNNVRICYEGIACWAKNVAINRH